MEASQISLVQVSYLDIPTTDITYSMPLKKTGQDQTTSANDDETKEDTQIGDGDPDDEDCDEDDDDWINDIGLHSNLRSKL